MTNGKDFGSIHVEEKYLAPKLHVYGGLVELTASGSGTRSESSFGNICSDFPNINPCTGRKP
ncbi:MULTISPECIES: hypothetical protein [Falsihalocynthiibacter]|uniref:hypothetical protein n=1 Tax=Falsihalocynthiibacter TaxID=2854182 RepID=UPI00300365C3